MYCKSVILALLALQIAESLQSNLQFRLSTSYDRTGLRVFTPDNIEKTSINVLKPVFVIIPDFENDDGTSYSSLVDELFEKDNYNVFTVERTSQETDSKVLGDEVSNFITSLIDTTGEKYLDINIIAYSEGGEVASYAARSFTESQNRKVSKITIYDPVTDQGQNSVVESADANLVELIHNPVPKA